MATDINVSIVTGRLTRDCEMKTTESGFSVCRFSIASNYYKKGAENNEGTNYFDCALLGKSAENLNQYLKKGTAVTIEGELRQQRWEANGSKNSKIELIVLSVKFSGSSQSQGQQNRNQVPDDLYSEPEKKSNGFDDDDDIPF